MYNKYTYLLAYIYIYVYAQIEWKNLILRQKVTEGRAE